MSLPRTRTSWPSLRVLVPPSTFGQVMERAKQEGKPVSKWCREIIEQALKLQPPLHGIIREAVSRLGEVTINRLCLEVSEETKVPEAAVRGAVLELIQQGVLKDGGLKDGERIVAGLARADQTEQ